MLETNFARSIFYPLQKKEFSKTINYGPWLKRFIVSLNWRIAVAFRWEDLSSGELSLLYDVAEDWRKYLIGEIIDIKSEHHLILLGPLKNSLVLGLPSNFLLHLRRNIDANIFNINNKLVVYTKLPSLIIASFIKPREPKNWENTKIYEKGTIIVPQRVVDDGILKYILVERARLVEKIKISQKQEKVVTKALLQDIERWIKSSSFDAFLADSELRGFKPDKTVFNKRCFCGSGKPYLDCCLLKKLKEIKNF
ncbi:MAG: SEC-C domain-containing protein [Candidatus Levybacteria bacterium]|nr:SEC-C domain-containing protein [Candidatus Levybacteria bacterium]